MTKTRPQVASELEQEFAFLVRALEAIGRKRGYPMERAHYLLMLQLEEGTRSIGELANALALDASTVTRQVAAMEKLQLVRKLANPADRRSALVEATPMGHEKTTAMRAARLERLNMLFSKWEDGDMQSLAGLLERLNGELAPTLAALDSSEEDGPAPGTERA